MLGAPALADLADPVGTDEREALRHHSGRAVEIAEPLNALASEAGFLLQLLDRRALDGRVRFLVTHKAGGKFEAACPNGHTILLDEDHLAFMLGEDDGGANTVGAGNIFPAPPLHRANIFALPHRLERRVAIVGHSS